SCHQIQNTSIIFFLSSRRRHTRFSRDWSSDVCSSDLMGKDFNQELLSKAEKLLDDDEGQTEIDCLKYNTLYAVTDYGSNSVKSRSEERRVGKECRCRRSRDE